MCGFFRPSGGPPKRYGTLSISIHHFGHRPLMLARAFLLALFNLIGFRYVVQKCQNSNAKMF